VQDLERDLPVMPEILGQIYGGHTPSTELAFDAVPVGEGVGGSWHGNRGKVVEALPVARDFSVT
jgi:hypothetical protein